MNDNEILHVILIYNSFNIGIERKIFCRTEEKGKMKVMGKLLFLE